jgi:hypothetical protein
VQNIDASYPAASTTRMLIRLVYTIFRLGYTIFSRGSWISFNKLPLGYKSILHSYVTIQKATRRQRWLFTSPNICFVAKCDLSRRSITVQQRGVGHQQQCCDLRNNGMSMVADAFDQKIPPV